MTMAHGDALALPVAVGGGPFIREEAELHMLFPPPLHGRGVMEMVTYSDLFQLGILIVNIITLVIQVNKKTK